MKELIKLFKLGVILGILLLFSYQEVSADCQGCCSGHGGVVCQNGITKCADGTSLSDTCVNKGCNICLEPPSCDFSHLGLCNDQSSCEGAGGYWCDNSCQSNSCPPVIGMPWLMLLLDNDTSSDFTGTYNFSEQYDLNISNGVALGLGSMTFEVTQIDSNNLNLQGTGTNPDEGTYSFELPLVVSGNTATLPTHPYPIPGGSGNLLELLLLSDGNNMVYTGIGQEQDNLADISLGVGHWLRTPTPVTIDDFVGTWSGTYYGDLNLSYTPEGFNVSQNSGSISKVDADTISIILDNEPFLLNVANGRATLANTPVTIASAVYHTISIVTDGLGLSWVMVVAELNDPTDVSVTIGLMTKQ